MKALVLINLCAVEYQDVAFERIAKDGASGATWLNFLNDAQRAIVLARPDANAVVQPTQLVAGTRQTLPAGALRLLGATRNMGVDGITPGKAIQMGDRVSQDAVNPNWHIAVGGGVVKSVFYDDKKTPLTYFVQPPIQAAPAVFIELELSKPPIDVIDANVGDITLSDVYSPAYQSWMLFRAYSIATQSIGYFQRAQFHVSNFFNLLGVKMRNDIFLTPNAGGANVANPSNLQVVK